VNGWILGYIIGGAVVVVVVLVLLALLIEARRTADKAEQITAQLRVGRDRSDALAEIDTTARRVARITTLASRARSVLAQGGHP
jgi:hypothetical protein